MDLSLNGVLVMHQVEQPFYPHVIRFIRACQNKPHASDDELCLKLGLSLDEFNVLLARWAGDMDVTQLRYFLTRQYTRQQFALGEDAMRSSNPPGNGAMLNFTAYSSLEFWQKAHDLCLKYGVVDTIFGQVLLGFTAEGLCHLTFHDVCDDPMAILYPRWAVGRYVRDQVAAESFAERIFNFDAGTEKIPAWTYGSDFQLKVWQTLLQLPSGCLVNYQQLAAQAGSPRAARAAGSAMANNHLSWLIPCHRVLRQNGDFGEYGGGVERKMALVAYEASRYR